MGSSSNFVFVDLAAKFVGASLPCKVCTVTRWLPCQIWDMNVNNHIHGSGEQTESARLIAVIFDRPWLVALIR